MNQLQDYKEQVIDLHQRSLKIFSQKKEPYTTCADELQKVYDTCQKEMQQFGPKIMVFGTYNAGKSTLINALLGKQEAKIGDIPTTDTIDSYHWHGYCFYDTPGVNAPIEHEKVTENQLDNSDVILFVISADTSFEDKKTYEWMQRIIKTGKKMLLVINNKGGLNTIELQNVREKILSNLEKFGSNRNIIEKISTSIVNAEDALEGRLENEQQLVQESRILELEDAIVREMRRVNSFDVLKRILDNLKKNIHDSVGIIEKYIKNNTTDEMNTRTILNEKIDECIKSQRAMVDTECMYLESALFACLPKPEMQKNTTEANDEAAINEKFNQEVQSRIDSIQGQLRTNVSRLVADLSETLHAAASEATVDFNSPLDNAFVIPDAPDKEDPRVHMPDAEDGSLITKFTAAGAMLPLLPLPAILAPIAPFLAALAALLPTIFGKSKDERERERIRAEVEARNEAEKQYARNIAIWRQDAREACASHAARVVRMLQTHVQKAIEQNSAVYLSKAKELERMVKSEVQEMRDVCDEGHVISRNIDGLKIELQQ